MEPAHQAVASQTWTEFVDRPAAKFRCNQRFRRYPQCCLCR